MADKSITLPYNFITGLYTFITDELNVVALVTQEALLKIELYKEKGKALDNDEVIKKYEEALKKIQKYVFDKAVPHVENSHKEMIKIGKILYGFKAHFGITF